MPTYPQTDQLQKILAAASRVVILQADNPDADSLGSALALEHVLGDMGKEPVLYCGVDIPMYLRYLPGWDRVVKDIPGSFDASIVVDASTTTLFEKLSQSGQQPWVATRPCIVLDHHQTTSKPLPFASVTINDGACSSTGELIFRIATQLHWLLNVEAQTSLMTAILGDTQGLTNQLTSASTYRALADMVDAGVNRPALEELRREQTKMPPEIFKYKATLIGRTQFLADGRIAIVDIPQAEINEFSPLYNPGPLIQGDTLQTAGVQVSIVLKHYDDGKITGAIRCNNGHAIADKLAEALGGGGHAYASGFKIQDGRPFNEVKSECIRIATDLLNNLEQGQPHETVQHTD